MSRRTARRERREKKRSKNKQEYTIENVATNAALYKAFKTSCKGVMFKESVQRYRLNVFFLNYETKQKLLKGQDVRQGVIKFIRNDRGKPRYIQSIHFKERVAQKAVCTEVLQPKFFKTFIKENSASQKGKGTLFASKTFEKHLQDFLKHYETGYILLIDFSKYFENIDHEKVFEFYNENIKDKRLNELCKSFVSIYDKGLGLGSEVSQFNAIAYLNKIDHYIKHNFKYYGRYMDDSYIIHHDKKELQEFFNKLLELYAELKISVNTKKTQIISIFQPFSFLKTHYRIKGRKIIKKPHPSSISRERRRLKKQIKLYFKGILDLKTIERSVFSWAGSMLRRHARKSVYGIFNIFKNIKQKEEK